ncbi:MAG: NADH-quinone oxidoreductase subunit L [Gammaproteobacteria bacterium]|nr:MAG: NADH-quinone oxidoreductase subunit L [Gammaproteobacteria bacterium]
MNPTVLIAIPLLPLLAAIVAGLGGRLIGRAGAHWLTCGAVAASCVLSFIVLKQICLDGVPVYDAKVYTWLVSDGLHMEVGFLIDRLTALMMAVVTFVSLCVHVYTIGYMSDDPGYTRFFSYISLFTFSMLMLVMANNFLQLFFGWEAVGLVSYLLIGFWYTRPSAIFANLKAFIVNRIGDFGFVLGIAGVVYFTQSLAYRDAFAAAPNMAQALIPLSRTWSVPALTLICICLFIGAMGKSAKRVIAYSTLSQLGYMTVALGVSAYGAAIFHLMTHAFFKALLFLAAGSVIIALHHEQDMRRMGGLAKYMPVTAATCWIGALALVGTPFFSGFYSKDAIIEAVGESHRWGATYAYWCVLCGVFVTALYTFRMLFLTFHGPERFRDAAHTDEAHADAARMIGPDEPTQVLDDGQAPGGDHSDHGHGATPRESPAVVTVPLVALAIPSILIGALTVGPVLFGHYFTGSILVLDRNDVLGAIGEEFGGPVLFALQGLLAAPFWLAAAGAVTAWAFFLRRPAWADLAARKARWLYRVLTEKYYFDWFNERILAALARLIGVGLWKGGDEALIDGAMVNGSAATVGWLGSVMRRVQSGYLYSYAFWMMIGLALLLGWFLAHARF